HHRPRTDASDRARGRLEVQGNLRPAGRAVQQRRIPAWPDGARNQPVSGIHVHADRRSRGGHARARGRSRAKGRGAARARPHAGRLIPDTRTRSSRHRRRLPDTTLLPARRPAGAAARRHPRAPAPSAEGHAHPMSPTQHALIADHVFDGAVVRSARAVVIEGSRVVALVPPAELPGSIATHRLPHGTWLAPGFIDVQVNGGGDVLFNDDTTPDGIRAIAAAHRRFGTTALLPTLITDTPDKTAAALAAVKAVVDSEPSVLGLHLEGPFLSPEKPGVHALDRIRVPNDKD